MTWLLNLALDLLFGKQEKIERRTCPPPPPRTPGLGLPETRGGKRPIVGQAHAGVGRPAAEGDYEYVLWTTEDKP